MDANTKDTFYRGPARRRKIALLYVMRPTSTLDRPVWDLLRSFSYYSGQNFKLPVNDGLFYLVMSPSGETLFETSRNTPIN